VLRLADHWVWDCWIADDGDRYHVFFLKAPRALGDPALRHTSARIGHATSADLTHWTVHDDALEPAAGSWDDLALWTGSVARGHDGVWRMYYTALSTRRGLGVRDQRIGMAESEDLFTWRRAADRPLVDPDPRWYSTLDDCRAASATWRDPFVFADPDGDGWHMVITARARDAPRRRDGVLAHARSADMVSWDLQPPLTQPGEFGELEVSQIRMVDGRPVLVFSCHPVQQAPALRHRWRHHCTWAVLGESLLGPWDMAAARPFTAEPHLYAASLARGRDGRSAFVGFRNREQEGIFAFELGDPIPVTVRGDALARPGDDGG
jgi:beta-fructofuranosidase